MDREARGGSLHGFRTWYQASNKLIMKPDIWEEWWRPACVLDMQPDMWSTRCRRACVWSHAKRHTGCHQPEAYWLVSPINTPRPQLISPHPDLSKPSHSVPLMIKWRCCPELVQFYGFRSVEVLLDTPPGSPKNCPEDRGDSVRAQISLSRPISFFMVKPRFCPSRDQSSPVKTFILGFGHVLSDQPAASRLEHSCRRCSLWLLHPPGCQTQSLRVSQYGPEDFHQEDHDKGADPHERSVCGVSEIHGFPEVKSQTCWCRTD
ncbi:hypothetical protein F2Q69_00023015 [Brassica cretica]|uniref:Uncharacterized protein n=1 Tax=Brassica cretica TaxID=69181 RepID=A0A8S9QDR2_BRACR|nr:hypothetical protein F2Q69_00023015 [Brassica cretica]